VLFSPQGLKKPYLATVIFFLGPVLFFKNRMISGLNAHHWDEKGPTVLENTMGL